MSTTSIPSWGERIAGARRQAGLSQVALCELLGCRQQQLSAWERDTRRPSDASKVRLAKALGCTVYELFPFTLGNGDEAAA